MILSMQIWFVRFCEKQKNLFSDGIIKTIRSRFGVNALNREHDMTVESKKMEA